MNDFTRRSSGGEDRHQTHGDYDSASAQQQREQRVNKANEAAAGLIEELESQGFLVSHVADLFNQKLAYRNAIPTLIRWLPLISNRDAKEDVVRALSVRWARPSAAGPLIAEFEQTSTKDELGLRWAIANALAVVAGEAQFETIARWASDPDYGRARQMLVIALGHIADPRSYELLVDLLADPVVRGHAIIALGALRDPRALAVLDGYLRDDVPWIRRAAAKAMRQLSTSSTRGAPPDP
jgi:HEAT repeat protein